MDEEDARASPAMSSGEVSPRNYSSEDEKEEETKQLDLKSK